MLENSNPVIRRATLITHRQLSAYKFNVIDGVASGRVQIILSNVIDGVESPKHFSLDTNFKINAESGMVDFLEVDKARYSENNGWSYEEVDYTVGIKDGVAIIEALMMAAAAYPALGNHYIAPPPIEESIGEQPHIRIETETSDDYMERYVDAAEGQQTAYIGSVSFPIQFDAKVDTHTQLAKWEDGRQLSEKIYTINDVDLTRLRIGDHETDEADAFYDESAKKWVDFKVQEEDMASIKELVIEKIKNTALS